MTGGYPVDTNDLILILIPLRLSQHILLVFIMTAGMYAPI